VRRQSHRECEFDDIIESHVDVSSVVTALASVHGVTTAEMGNAIWSYLSRIVSEN
jgi:hypothetical protein